MPVYPTPSGYLFSNWSGTEHCAPRNYYLPTSEEEVAQLVRVVEGRGERLRVVGAGHAFSPLVLTDEHLVSLDGLNKVIAVDVERQRVTVQAGIRLKELNELLPQHGLALANLGSIADQSVAGATSTGTHGTGIKFGNLSTQLVALTLVGGGGRVRRLTLDSDPELMQAARLGLGCLGVVAEVTIQCVPAFRLRMQSWPMKFDAALGELDQLLAAYDHLRLYWFANTDIILVTGSNPTDLPITPRTHLDEYVEDVILHYDALDFAIRAGHVFPFLVAPFNQLSAKVGFRKEERVDRSDKILTIPMPPVHDECEYAVPVEQAAEAVRQLRQMIRQYDLKADVPVEVRFVAADDLMVSPTYQRAGCHVGAYTYGRAFSVPYFDHFEARMKLLGGRPHWGKHLTMTAEEARRMYPMYERFNAIRKEFDPAGVFANEFVRRVFP
jgi:L-gulonolactone oxidase